MTEDERKAWNAFTSQAREIADNFQREIEGQEMPEILYHYTNDVGLRGILESGKLWLTDVFHMNDPSELLHGFGVFLDVLKEEVKERSDFVDLPARMKPFRDRLDESAEYYSFSFSTEKDDLGQWRAYADDGCGFALGFAARDIESYFIESLRNSEGSGGYSRVYWAAFPLTYDDEKLRDLHSKHAQAMLDSADALLEHQNIFFPTVASHAAVLSLSFKLPAYKNEQEYRFLQGLPMNTPAERSGAKWRSRPYEMVKYLEFDWRSGCPDALRVIRIGPSADQDKAERFVRECERMFKLASVTIERSEIPYRRMD